MPANVKGASVIAVVQGGVIGREKYHQGSECLNHE
jgi:hypothetical protein